MVTWVDLDGRVGILPASVNHESGSATSPTLSRPSNTAAFRIRWRDDVDETMRVVHDGHEWDIEGIVARWAGMTSWT